MNASHHGGRTMITRGRILTLLLGGALLLGAACSKDQSPPAPTEAAATATAAASATSPATATAIVAAPGRGGSATATGTARAGSPSPAAAARTATPSPASGARTATPSGSARAATVTPAPDTPNPCTLVTVAEAGTALDGRPLPGSMRRSRDSAEVRCTYTVLLGADGRTVVVAVWKGSEAAPVYELRRSAYAGAAEDMPGLGDRAFIVRGDEGWVNVLKGDIYMSVEIDYRGLSDQEIRNRALTLTRLALGRL